MEEIELNGKKYVLKEDIKENRLGVIDTANITMVFNIGEDWRKEDMINIPKPALTLKENGSLNSCTLDFDKTKITTKEGTKIGYDMYKIACRLVNALELNKTNKEILFQVYEGWDKELKIFKKDYPVFLVSRDYGVLVAPRIENG